MPMPPLPTSRRMRKSTSCCTAAAPRPAACPVTSWWSVLIGLPGCSQEDGPVQIDDMPIRLIDLSVERYPAWGFGLGAEPDRIGRAFLEVIEHLQELHMPIGAVNDGDVHAVDGPFRGQG